MNFRLLLGVIAVLALSGCSITKSVTPVKTPVSQVCIAHNPAVLMDGFHPELEKQIQDHGIQTKSYTGQLPKGCSHRLEYTANWRWDFAMYLVYADLRVFDQRGLAGSATYDAYKGGSRFDKFGRTADKLRPLVDELFGSAPKVAAIVQPSSWEQVVDRQSTSADRLRELDSLKEEGLITQEEYDRKRQEILGQI